MLNFTAEMGRIAQDLRRASEDRARCLCGIREETRRIQAQTARFLRDTSRRHGEASDKTRDGLVRFVADLRANVNGLLEQSRGRLQAFGDDFRRGGRVFHRTLGQAAGRAEQWNGTPTRAKAHGAPRHGSPTPRPRAGRGAHR